MKTAVNIAFWIAIVVGVVRAATFPFEGTTAHPHEMKILAFRPWGDGPSNPAGPPTRSLAANDNARKIQDGYNASAADIREVVPSNWRVETQSWSAVGLDSTAEPRAVVAIPWKELPKRYLLSLGPALGYLALVSGLWFARKALRAVFSVSPFDPSCYQSLRIVVLIGFVASFVVPLASRWGRDAIVSSLPLGDQLHTLPRTDAPHLFDFSWLLGLAVIEILRYGGRIKAENDATI